MSAGHRSRILLAGLCLAGWAAWPAGAAKRAAPAQERKDGQSSGERAADEDRRQVAALEREWLDGGSNRATLERVLASDFVHPVSAGVFLSKQQHIEWSLAHPRPPNRRARFETLDIRLYGDAAVASGIVENTDLSGSDRHRTIFTDVFVRRGGLWQAVSASENEIAVEAAGRK